MIHKCPVLHDYNQNLEMQNDYNVIKMMHLGYVSDNLRT